MKIPVKALGVSVAICSHNGEKRLSRVLANLRAQHTTQVPWEVLLIDNASTDRTTEIARECWPNDSPAPLRVVSEPRLGLSHARVRAFSEARYELVSFIDDDNWVAPDWVNAASRAMSADPSLGAILSVNRPVADGPLPQWFQRYCGYYAAWAIGESAPPPPPHVLIGAGMTIRKAAFTEMACNGFRPLATDRVGRRLSSAGDMELGYSLMLAGWKFRLERSLHLEHYLTHNRLEWSYFRRLVRAQEESNVVLDSYFWAAQHAPGLKNRFRERWWWHFAVESIAMMRHHSVAKLVSACVREMEDDGEIIEIEKRIGRLIGFARMRSRYRAARRNVARAPWRRRDSFLGLVDH
jgi:glycosyltransferase involved in cell wall biosynthesis